MNRLHRRLTFSVAPRVTVTTAVQNEFHTAAAAAAAATAVDPDPALDGEQLLFSCRYSLGQRPKTGTSRPFGAKKGTY